MMAAGLQPDLRFPRVCVEQPNQGHPSLHLPGRRVRKWDTDVCVRPCVCVCVLWSPASKAV